MEFYLCKSTAKKLRERARRLHRYFGAEHKGKFTCMALGKTKPMKLKSF